MCLEIVVFFFFKVQGLLWCFCCTFNILIGGRCGEQIDSKKLLLCSSKRRKRLCVSFFKDLLFSSWYHKKNKETWHLLLFDTLSQDIAVEINVGQLYRVPARRLGTEYIGTVGWPKWDILWIEKKYSDHF